MSNKVAEEAVLLMAQDGNVDAQVEVADTHYRRNDYKEAMKWFRMAADNGSAYAQYSLGHIYFEDGQHQNKTEAAKWLKLAADQGHPASQYLLALLYFNGSGVQRDYKEAARLCRLAANQDYQDAINDVKSYEMMAEPPPSTCVIATACLGEDSDRVSVLRKLRDDGISADPIVRDFFHIFWSHYYEWSPGVARIAAQDSSVAKHIRWAFLDPWFAWIEISSIIGRRDISILTQDEQLAVMKHLNTRLSEWLLKLPSMLEEKCPSDPKEVFEAFERFREIASKRLVAE